MWEPAKILLFALVTFSVAAFHEAGDFAGDTAKEMQSLSLEETLTSVVARATAAKRRSKAEIEQMKSACVKNFETVDADRDDRLSLGEFQRLLKMMGEKHGF
ncbi:unnamed protein product [Durusdinium trenchii]|uniref:EF-hand domain-containing protein n=1 Tax=Durusdinium trenchii TaxID=1381693 RepID=A0ABP0SWH3_9DINO